MNFCDFDLPRAEKNFSLVLDGTKSLFTGIAPIPISAELAGYWEKVLSLGLALGTEKARSELITAPLLAEVWHRSNRQIALLSGVEWLVDDKAGLNGVTDFLLCRSRIFLYVTSPVFLVVEAKRDSIPDGLGQCAAEMVAAQRFNEQAGKPIDPIYGCVTTGSVWKFLRLRGKQLDIDIGEYFIDQPDRILGVLMYCCGVTAV